MDFNVQTVIELINGVGFPISMCVALFWLNNSTLKAQQKALMELQVTIQNNTQATTNLAEMIKRS